MSMSTWLSNEKVEFSIVQKNNRSYIVCTSSVGVEKLYFVEDVQTSKRLVNTLPHPIWSEKELDDLVLQFIDTLEHQIFMDKLTSKSKN